jgi:hypothetical protein
MIGQSDKNKVNNKHFSFLPFLGGCEQNIPEAMIASWSACLLEDFGESAKLPNGSKAIPTCVGTLWSSPDEPNAPAGLLACGSSDACLLLVQRQYVIIGSRKKQHRSCRSENSYSSLDEFSYLENRADFKRPSAQIGLERSVSYLAGRIKLTRS